MKNLIKNTFVLIALSVAFSSWTACNRSSNANGTNGAKIEVASNASNSATKTETANTETSADNPYPPAPEAVLQTENKDLEGNVIKLADYKGKVVLVNLWATWCGPCRGEMPHLIEMQEKYRDKGFEVVGLDVDEESVEAINSFAKENKLNYKLGFADEKTVNAFIKLTKLSGIPQSVLINREGRMTGIFSGGGPKVIGQMKEAVDKTMGNS